MRRTRTRSCVRSSSEDLLMRCWSWCLRFVQKGSIESSALARRRVEKGNDMRKAKSFPFERARRITPDEVKRYRKAIETKLGKKRAPRRGRPPKAASAKYLPVAIRLHPLV